MNPNSFRRAAGTTIAALAIALTGIVATPAPAAHAAPTAWTCTVDTFVWRAGVMNQVVATSGVPSPTTGPTLVASPLTVTMTNLNGIARHPITGIVYANNVGSPIGQSARVINPDGTVEDASATVPMTGTPTTGFGGGTFTPDGHWLLVEASGRFISVDLTSSSSPTYGQMVHQGTIRKTAGGATAQWMSGDLAYRASDERIYFTTWSLPVPALPNPPTPTQVGWIPLSAFSGIPTVLPDIIPTLGPIITVPLGANTSGAASGFDSSGNLWMSTNVSNPAANQAIWRLDSADLTSVGPITPANPVYLPSGSGTDGFMCRAAAAPAPAPVEPTLAETGSVTNALPIAGGSIAILAGGALVIFAGRRRRVV